MSPEEQQEAITRAINSIKDSANQQAAQEQTGQNLGQAPTPTPNPYLPGGVVRPTAPGANPDEHPENTMQADPTNLKNALQGKTRDQQLQDLGITFPQK